MVVDLAELTSQGGSVYQMFRQLTAASFSGAYTWCCLSCQSEGRNVDLIYKMHYKALFMMLPSWAYCLCVLLSLERSFSVDIYRAIISVKMPGVVSEVIAQEVKHCPSSGHHVISTLDTLHLTPPSPAYHEYLRLTLSVSNKSLPTRTKEQPVKSHECDFCRNHLDMEDTGTSCPLPLQETNPGKRLCIKSAPTGCSSVVYSTHGVPYSRICGRVRGYSYNSPDAFGEHTGPKNINSAYTDGVSITYGSPRKHVWTYAAGLQEEANYHGDACPCGKVPGNQPPSFVGNDYYCESANQGPWEAQWYLQDPLWDGNGCPSDNNCCANAGLPWFCKTLPTKVTEDIEVRLCYNEGRNNEDIGVELLEILVH